VARQLRGNPATQSIPLVALTGYGQVRDKRAAALAGFDVHLVKPVEPAQVLKAVEEVLARAAALED
jgi:CheY-like chemotaxis protein